MPYQVIAELEVLFGVSETEAAAIAPWVVDALVANFAGDEAPTVATRALLSNLLGQDEPLHTLGLLLSTLWYDVPFPAGDNTLKVPVGN